LRRTLLHRCWCFRWKNNRGKPDKPDTATITTTTNKIIAKTATKVSRKQKVSVARQHKQLVKKHNSSRKSVGQMMYATRKPI